MTAPPIERIETIRAYLTRRKESPPADVLRDDLTFMLEQLDKLHAFVHERNVVAEKFEEAMALIRAAPTLEPKPEGYREG